MFIDNFKYRYLTWRRLLKEYSALRKQKSLYLQQLKKSIQRIQLINSKEIPNEINEIRLFAILRNESLRLPHFIKYYKELGVDRFFFIDNNSTDNSSEIILEEKTAHLFYTTETYINHWYWMEYLLESYGKNHWCVVVDIDELFSFPHSESLTIKDIIKFLDKEKSTAVHTFLLDMYSDKSIKTTSYQMGENPIFTTSYFDKSYDSENFTFYDRVNFKLFSSSIFTGGMRERVFGKTNPPHILSKIPLFKNMDGAYLAQGMHAINGAMLSQIQGVVFHTKFLSDFIEEVKEETKREQHYGGAFYYKHFETQLNKDTEISFYNENSVKYQDSNQLVELGLMNTTEAFEKFCQSLMK